MRARLLLPKLLPVLLLSLSLSLLGACSSGPRTTQPSERQAKAMAMWKERCKTAGEKIHKTVDNVEGIYLMKIRTTTNFGDQFTLDDPYGSDSNGDMYLLNFLRGFYHQRATAPIPGDPPRVGYFFVEAQDPKDGQRYRYTGGVKAVGRRPCSSLRCDLRRHFHPPNVRYGSNFDFPGSGFGFPIL